MSQIIIYSLPEDVTERSGLIPCLIKIMDLSRRMGMPEHAEAFKDSWNLCDAYLQVTLGGESARYRFLRQAVMYVDQYATRAQHSTWT